MNSPSVLSLRGLCRDYAAGGRVLNVLTGIDLDVQPGEVVGLIGPSGSGKSSLLHAAGLLETPSAGQVLLSGVDYTGASDRDRTRARLQYLGFVYQFHHLLPELSALDNAAWPMRIAGVSRHDARLRAKTSLIALGLGERLDHQPAQLSGGEQQRVAIARALSHGPKLILADEPTGNLDPDTSRTVFAALAQSARQGGTAALIATHNHELAAHMDRVFALEHGKLKAIS